MYYVLMTIVDNNTTAQQKGLVEIVYHVEGNSTFNFQDKRRIVSLRESLPIRTAAIHACMDGPTSQLGRIFFNMIRPFVNLQAFSRIRLHAGKLANCFGS